MNSRVTTFLAHPPAPPDGSPLPSVVQARNLTKRYESFVAVDGIDFDIRRGECFGFLGPNGAGKTTTIKMINCTSPVTEGQLWVDGKDVRRDQRAIKSVLGVVSQADSLDEDLTVLQNLVCYGRYFNLPARETLRQAHEALAFFNLGDRASQTPDELSGGMRRRLLIARVLLHRPHILLLDEPTTGLDPQSRLLVWEKLSQLKDEGITILLTTHYMAEASYLCDRLVVMDSGKILVEGAPDDLVERHAGAQVTEVRAGHDERPQLVQALLDAGADLDQWGDSIVVYHRDGAGIPPDLGLAGYRVTTRPGNLEDVFLRLTGRGLREE